MFNSFLKLTSISFALLLLPISIMAQELPSSSLYVVTSCYLNEGSSFLDAVEEARATIPNDDNAANMMFFRQPLEQILKKTNFLELFHGITYSIGRNHEVSLQLKNTVAIIIIERSIQLEWWARMETPHIQTQMLLLSVRDNVWSKMVCRYLRSTIG